MSARIPWDVAKRIFVLNEIPKAHGWDKTVERLGNHEDDSRKHADGFPRGMHHDQGLAAHENTRTALDQLCETEFLKSPVNLFPLIDLIYRAPNEGNVVELAFGTTTASLKHEKMRRSATDLRRELYHRGGKQALGTPIEPYRLSVEYALNFDGVDTLPEVSLNGSSRMAGSASPTLYDAVVRKCVGVADYEHVRSRIVHFIGVHEAKQKKS